MKNLRVRKKRYKKGFTLAEAVSKITITDNMTTYIANKLDSYVGLKGVKIVNKLGRGTWY
jgi:hypothetical protein